MRLRRTVISLILCVACLACLLSVRKTADKAGGGIRQTEKKHTEQSGAMRARLF